MKNYKYLFCASMLYLPFIGNSADAHLTNPPNFNQISSTNLEWIFDKYTPPPIAINSQSTFYPTIGYWMIVENNKLSYKDDEIAHWLGQKQNGKYTLEPINIRFYVKASDSNAANNTIVSSLKASGFGSGGIHSSGYSAYVNGYKKQQFPEGVTFSNPNWFVQNDHIRLFGPVEVEVKGESQYMYLGACSEEGIALFGHRFVSFDHCRTLLSRIFNTNKMLDIGNTYNQQKHSTRDHDGKILMVNLTQAPLKP